jgi:hypothetical protein
MNVLLDLKIFAARNGFVAHAPRRAAFALLRTPILGYAARSTFWSRLCYSRGIGEGTATAIHCRSNRLITAGRVTSARAVHCRICSIVFARFRAPPGRDAIRGWKNDAT